MTGPFGSHSMPQVARLVLDPSAPEAPPAVAGWSGLDPEAVFQAVLATGGDALEGFSALLRVGDPACHARALTEAGAWLLRDPAWVDARLLDLLAFNPDFANGAFALCVGQEALGFLKLSGVKDLRALPERFRVGGDLDLTRAERLGATPPGLRVGGNLFLEGCPALERLGAGLVVGQSLFLQNCGVWDGRIPVDTQVGSRLYTRRYPQGIVLKDWHRLHGGGSERCASPLVP
jgi:hypothetical protein